MKKGIKYIIGCSAVALVAFAVLLFSCNGKKDRGSANTAFAQSTEKTEDNKGVVEIPKTSLSVVEALQDVNRSISREVLPSVVKLMLMKQELVQKIHLEIHHSSSLDRLRMILVLIHIRHKD